ncbi:MAG TPA: hypothetical protein DCS55_21905 [Acidimicrobiaceae bacterium]|nr:hypothetical protein [Acidimicrobiaceae bacterium]
MANVFDDGIGTGGPPESAGYAGQAGLAGDPGPALDAPARRVELDQQPVLRSGSQGERSGGHPG